jgi:hypothetical protein
MPSKKSRSEEVLRRLKVEDLQVDSYGRIVINNPDVVRELMETELGAGGGEAAWNIGCSNTGCGTEALRDEIMRELRRRGGGQPDS